MKPQLNPDDPRLSAYALDELSETDRKAFETELESSENGEQLLDDVVDTAAQVREMFRMEEIPTGQIELPTSSAPSNIIRPEYWSQRAAWITAAAAGIVAAVGVFSYIDTLDYKATNELMRVEIAEAQNQGGAKNSPPEFRVTILRDAPQLVEAKPIPPLQKIEDPFPDLDPELTSPPELETIDIANIEPEPEPIVAAAPNTMKFADVNARPDSSFNLAVGDSSYEQVKSAVAAGEAPNLGDVRIEELVNHFSYEYAEPENPKAGIAVDMEVAECPWNEKTRLVRIGLRGEILAQVPSAAQIDVKFNPYQVRSYRLLGYTGKDGQPIDAARPTGRIAVTALYEIEPINPTPAPTEPKPQENRYSSQPRIGEHEQRDVRLGTNNLGEMFQFPQQLLTLKLGERAKIQLTDEGKSLGDASPDFRFAAAVAAFGMRLSGDGKLDYQEIAALAEQGLGENTEIAKERREFVQLAKRARKLER